MPYYARQGTLPSKRSTTLRSSTGRLRYEELMTSGGFAGPSSYLYHLRQPTRVDRVEPMADIVVDPWDTGAIRNHLIDVEQIKCSGDDDPLNRATLFFNDDLVYSLGAPGEVGDRCFYRNGFADELILVAAGSGVMESSFGDLRYEPLDFVYVPRGTTWRIRPDSGEQSIVVMETPGSITPPAHYRNAAGQFLARSIYSERDIKAPAFREPIDEEGSFEVRVKTGTTLTRCVVPNHPFDVVGWDGALYPYALNMRSVEPLSGRIHLMPDMHQVFGSTGVFICAITPSRLPDHPEIYPAQPDHLADCDEIFYRVAAEDPPAAGLGTITLHTRAALHGPKPGFENVTPPKRTSLYGLILDTVRPVRLTTRAKDADRTDYHRAWM